MIRWVTPDWRRDWRCTICSYIGTVRIGQQRPTECPACNNGKIRVYKAQEE